MRTWLTSPVCNAFWAALTTGPSRPSQWAGAALTARYNAEQAFWEGRKQLPAGDQTSPANLFPPEDFVNGFRNQSQAQSLSPLLIENYSAAAEKLARNAFRGGDTRGLIPCKPSAACRTRFVREFGIKAFRRPLEAEEQKRYETLMSREPDFVKGAQLVVEAMLQSSNFLFRFDETSEAKWKPYATASRLSVRPSKWTSPAKAMSPWVMGRQ